MIMQLDIVAKKDEVHEVVKSPKRLEFVYTSVRV